MSADFHTLRSYQHTPALTRICRRTHVSKSHSYAVRVLFTLTVSTSTHTNTRTKTFFLSLILELAHKSHSLMQNTHTHTHSYTARRSPSLTVPSNPIIPEPLIHGRTNYGTLWFSRSDPTLNSHVLCSAYVKFFLRRGCGNQHKDHVFPWHVNKGFGHSSDSRHRCIILYCQGKESYANLWEAVAEPWYLLR